MKASELRIGNLVREEVLGDVTISELYRNGYASLCVKNMKLDRTIEDNFYTVNYQNIYPIPISEEWLKRMGFFQLNHFTITNSWMINLGRNRQITIGSVGSPNCMAFLQEIGRDKNGNEKIDDIICLYNWDYDSQLYVHEVQNMYHILSRKELEVKP